MVRPQQRQNIQTLDERRTKKYRELSRAQDNRHNRSDLGKARLAERKPG